MAWHHFPSRNVSVRMLSNALPVVACGGDGGYLKEERGWRLSTSTARSHDVAVEPDTPLLWVIREQVGLTGTKYGCGVAQCGACSVHLNGEVVRSCSIPVSAVGATDRIVTIEGLSPTARSPVQQAWAALDVPQCGYCQSGQIMAAAALLAQEAESDGQRHRRGDDQHLPVRHLPAHPRGRPHGGGHEGRRRGQRAAGRRVRGGGS